jgi:hypothetical protein
VFGLPSDWVRSGEYLDLTFSVSWMVIVDKYGRYFDLINLHFSGIYRKANTQMHES